LDSLKSKDPFTIGSSYRDPAREYTVSIQNGYKTGMQWMLEAVKALGKGMMMQASSWERAWSP
jgi:hypothetical protein